MPKHPLRSTLTPMHNALINLDRAIAETGEDYDMQSELWAIRDQLNDTFRSVNREVNNLAQCWVCGEDFPRDEMIGCHCEDCEDRFEI